MTNADSHEDFIRSINALAQSIGQRIGRGATFKIQQQARKGRKFAIEIVGSKAGECVPEMMKGLSDLGVKACASSVCNGIRLSFPFPISCARQAATYEVSGRRMTVMEIAEKVGMTPEAMRTRINTRGLSVAANTPVLSKKECGKIWIRLVMGSERAALRQGACNYSDD